MASISMCMIVKNEEAILRRCLDSYKGTYDELIIVDTGSTDNTKSIAFEYTDKVFDYTWINDFADARNFAFSKATCDYIFSADADEVLDEPNRKAYMDLKKVLMPEIDIVQMKYVNSTEFNTVYNYKKEYRPKLFKRLRTFTWISPIHETVRLNPIIFDSDIEILHRPTNNHSKRDFSTFINAIKQGIQLEDYVVIMFCKELFISGSDDDFLAVKDSFENTLALENRSSDCERNILCVLTKIYRLCNQKDDFYKFALSDMEHSNGPCAEICIELALNYYNLKDYYTAIKWFEKAAFECESIIDIRCSGNLPRHYLSKCYLHLKEDAKCAGDEETALKCDSLAIKYKEEADNWIYPEEI